MYNSMCHNVTGVSVDSRQACDIKVSLKSQVYLYINEYCPFDLHSAGTNNALHKEVLGDVESVLNAGFHGDVIICCDCNTDFTHANI